MRPVKLAFLILLYALYAMPTFGQWPYIPIRQTQNSATAGSSPISCGYPTNVASGDILVISATWITGAGTPVISDTQSASWTQNVLDTADTVKLLIATASAPSSGAETVTITETSATGLVVNCTEFPANWSLTVDASSTNALGGTPASITSNTITTTLNTDLIYSVIGGNVGSGFNLLDSTSITAGFNQICGRGSGSAAFLVGGANGNYNVKWSNTNNTSVTVGIIAFKSNSLAVTSPIALPDGALSTSYNYTLTAAGGSGAYTWSITSGTLQSGLSLNASTGAITGTPLSGPTNNITFQVADTNSHTATEAVTLKVSSSLNAITFVQGKKQAINNSTLAFTSNVTAGNLIVVAAGYGAVTFSPCSDSRGTPFQIIFNQNNVLSSTISTFRDLIYVGIAPSTGADTVSCSASLMAIGEFSNVNFVTQDNTGVTTGNTASPATVTSNTLTTLVPNEVILGTCETYTSTGTMTIQSPFTSVDVSTPPVSLGYDIVTTVTGYTMSCAEASNTSGQWLFGLAALRPSGGAAAPTGGRGPKGKIL